MWEKPLHFHYQPKYGALTGYSPTICFAIEGNTTKWIVKILKWGMTLGLRLETKGMEARARVKNYSMEIIGDGGERLAGYWTGKSKKPNTEALISRFL